MILRSRRAAVAAQVAVHQHMTGRKHVRPKVLPRSAHPTLLEAEYAGNIIALAVGSAREAFKPLIDALPELLASARADRVRLDEFNPDQPRDEQGRWSEAGAAGGTNPGKLAARIAAAQEREHGWGKLARAPEQVAKDVTAHAARETEAHVAMLAADVKLKEAEAKGRANPPPKRLANEQDIKDLGERQIVGLKKLGGGTSVSEIATLDDGSHALWKPATGEEHGLRDNIEGGTYYLREAAASKVAAMLGVGDLVPAVVVHTHTPVPGTSAAGRGDREGSLQAWNPDAKKLYDQRVPFDRESSERMRVFDYVIGNSDRHGNNVMVGKDDKPVLIDHGLAFPNGSPVRFIQPTDAMTLPKDGKLLPSTHAQIKAIDPTGLARTLHGSGIEQDAIRSTVRRAMYLQANPEILAVHSDFDPHSENADMTWNAAARADTSEHAHAANQILHSLPKRGAWGDK